MGHLAIAPALSGNQIVRQGNATCGHLAQGSGISARNILPANAQTVSQSDEIVFVRISYDLDFGGPEDEIGLFQTEHIATSPTVITTPSLQVVPATQGHTVSQPSHLVNHALRMANATQGHIVQPIPGFANRSQGVANARMDHAVAAPRMIKRVLAALPQMGHTTSIVSLQRNSY